jgi:hypothetical protein
MQDQGTALIKFSETEIECLVNSLYMTISLKVPTENNGDWKTPYRILLKEVEGINYQLKEKKRDFINDKKTSYQAPESCKNCND